MPLAASLHATLGECPLDEAHLASTRGRRPCGECPRVECPLGGRPLGGCPLCGAASCPRLAKRLDRGMPAIGMRKFGVWHASSRRQPTPLARRAHLMPMTPKSSGIPATAGGSGALADSTSANSRVEFFLEAPVCHPRQRARGKGPEMKGEPLGSSGSGRGTIAGWEQ